MNWDSWRHYLRALWHELRRNHQRAVAEYQTVLAYDPTFYRALHAIGFHYAASNQHAEALGYLTRASALRPRNADLLFNLGFLYEKDSRPDKAIESFRAAVAINPKLDRAWYGMGLAYAALGQHPQAAESFDRAARLKPMTGPIWYQLGMAYHHARNPERVKDIVKYLDRFDRHLARKLIVDANRSDLTYLVKDLQNL